MKTEVVQIKDIFINVVSKDGEITKVLRVYKDHFQTIPTPLVFGMSEKIVKHLKEEEYIFNKLNNIISHFNQEKARKYL